MMDQSERARLRVLLPRGGAMTRVLLVTGAG